MKPYTPKEWEKSNLVVLKKLKELALETYEIADELDGKINDVIDGETIYIHGSIGIDGRTVTIVEDAETIVNASQSDRNIVILIGTGSGGITGSCVCTARGTITADETTFNALVFNFPDTQEDDYLEFNKINILVPEGTETVIGFLDKYTINGVLKIQASHVSGNKVNMYGHTLDEIKSAYDAGNTVIMKFYNSRSRYGTFILTYIPYGVEFMFDGLIENATGGPTPATIELYQEDDDVLYTLDELIVPTIRFTAFNLDGSTVFPDGDVPSMSSNANYVYNIFKEIDQNGSKIYYDVVDVVVTGSGNSSIMTITAECRSANCPTGYETVILTSQDITLLSFTASYPNLT